ncbi:MAG: hypothetical protein R2867_12550 [Caldilineaceae bacterium]
MMQQMERRAGTTPFRTQSFPSTSTTVTTYDKYGRVTKVPHRQQAKISSTSIPLI